MNVSIHGPQWLLVGAKDAFGQVDLQRRENAEAAG